MNHRVVLLGTSLSTASIGAALADRPDLALFPVELARDDTLTWVDALRPDVVLFDLAAGLPNFALRHLAACADLSLIGFDLETQKMLLLSGTQAAFLTTEDLVRAVKGWRPQQIL